MIANVSWAPNHYIEWFMEDCVTLKAEAMAAEDPALSSQE